MNKDKACVEPVINRRGRHYIDKAIIRGQFRQDFKSQGGDDGMDRLHLAHTNTKQIPKIEFKFQLIPIISYEYVDKLNLSTFAINAVNPSNIFDTKLPFNNLREINLSHSQLTLDMMRKMTDSLMSGRLLKVFNLSFSNIAAISLDYILDDMVRCSNITKLDLSYNFGILGLPGATDGTLQLIGLGGSIPQANKRNDGTISFLLENLKRLKSLGILMIRNNRMSEDDLKHFSENMEFMSKLEYLDIGSCQISTSGFREIGRNLKYLVELKTFILDGNSGGSDGINEIITNFKYMTNLSHLDIHSGSILTANLKLLRENLKYLSNLKSIVIFGNDGGWPFIDGGFFPISKLDEDRNILMSMYPEIIIE